jgi:hypothetical protein
VVCERIPQQQRCQRLRPAMPSPVDPLLPRSLVLGHGIGCTPCFIRARYSTPNRWSTSWHTSRVMPFSNAAIRVVPSMSWCSTSMASGRRTMPRTAKKLRQPSYCSSESADSSQIRGLSSVSVSPSSVRTTAAVEGRPSIDGAVAFVRGARRRNYGTRGAAHWATQRRRRCPDPTGLAAAIFDPEHVTTRLAVPLDLLLAVPVPMSARIVPVVEIAPAMLVTRGTVGMPRHGAVTIRMSDQPVRTEAVEAVSADGLRRTVTQVAKELAARLDQAFGG